MQRGGAETLLSFDGAGCPLDFTDEEREGLYKAIFTRRDVRSHFTGKPLGEAVIRRILEAAHRAPSVGFSQPWNFVLIRDERTRRAVKESFEEERARSAKLVEEPRRSEYLSFKLEGILESSLNVCVTYDPSRSGPFVIGRSSMPEAGVYSVCCAVQNLWLAARAEGVGVGWVSILSVDSLRSILGIPERVVPVAYLCVGHVEEFAQKPDLESAGWLPRMPLEKVVNSEKWGEPAFESEDNK